MKKEVRLAKLEDLDFIYESLQEDLIEQGVIHRFKYSKEAFKEAIFGAHPIAQFLILEIDGKQVGFANYNIDYRNYTVNHGPTLYLNDLFIKSTHRRKRCATFLFEKVKEVAKQKNCARIEGVVLQDNTEALQFYKDFLGGKILQGLHYMRLELNS